MYCSPNYLTINKDKMNNLKIGTILAILGLILVASSEFVFSENPVLLWTGIASVISGIYFWNKK